VVTQDLALGATCSSSGFGRLRWRFDHDRLLGWLLRWLLVLRFVRFVRFVLVWIFARRIRLDRLLGCLGRLGRFNLYAPASLDDRLGTDGRAVGFDLAFERLAVKNYRLEKFDSHWFNRELREVNNGRAETLPKGIDD
jgi:hypothetical protein